MFHASLLTPYRETTQKGANFTRPPPELVEGEAEYEVKEIVKHRHHGRQKVLQYLIKWKDYPSCDNTWEPVEQVFAPALLKAYHQKHPLDQPVAPR